MFDHPPPDLSTKAGRKAWRHELRMVAIRPRRYGLWLLAIGFLLMMAPAAFGIHSILGWSPTVLGMIAGLAALPFLVAATLLRRRYLRGRNKDAAA
ncbi:MAG: hypothetical protein PSY12_05300 [bacterium]|nr:hypothetical protein [bacterium]